MTFLLPLLHWFVQCMPQANGPGSMTAAVVAHYSRPSLAVIYGTVMGEANTRLVIDPIGCSIDSTSDVEAKCRPTGHYPAGNGHYHELMTLRASTTNASDTAPLIGRLCQPANDTLSGQPN